MNPYFERKILDADPIDLVRLLHQHAIACVKEARGHLAAGRIAPRAKAITRAYAVMAELNNALRPEVSPELTNQLRSLYLFVQQQLLEANAQQADKPLADALGVLATLLEGWNGVAEAAAARAEEAVARNYAPANLNHVVRLTVSA
ncbi:MAG TPA: flagellar export chaperone FliS [Bryobacteraceae bacterium]|nr:flagellar export chaperone FliS [Bryobacteraceae bacterium]